MTDNNSLESRIQKMADAGTQRALETDTPSSVHEQKVEERAAVLSALENPQYVWRTIDGISRETNIPPSLVPQILRELSDTIIESSIPDEEGHPLFTTRRHYKAKRGTINRIISAVSDVVK